MTPYTWSKKELELAEKISRAVYADEMKDGCDLSAGMFGENLSALIREIVANQKD